jgi:hypothetical protein
VTLVVLLVIMLECRAVSVVELRNILLLFRLLMEVVIIALLPVLIVLELELITVTVV